MEHSKLLAALSIASSAALSILLGVFIAPLFAPHCAIHVAQSHILYKVGSGLAHIASAIKLSAPCILDALCSLSTFLYLFALKPVYDLFKDHKSGNYKEQLMDRTRISYEKKFLPTLKKETTEKRVSSFETLHEKVRLEMKGITH